LFLGIFHIGLNLSGQSLNTVLLYAAGGLDYNTVPHFL
jgi:hypothetical protein